MRVCTWATAAFIVLSPAAAFGWNDAGHEIVAAIAYSRLNPAAKAKVDRLLAVPIDPAGRSEPADPAKRFMHASHWADDVRSRLPQKSVEHYIDLPQPSDPTPVPKDQPEADNVITALEKYVQTLRSGREDAEAAMALRFVIHFVGDIHQPLHGATRISRALPEGDRGGNLFMVRVPDDTGTLHPVRLHAYWDGGLDTFPKEGEQFAPPPDEQIPPAMAAVLAGHPDTNPEITAGGPFYFQGWAEESHELAREVAYDHLQPDDAPTDAYRKKGVEIARRRVAWAGYRLAALLNAIWHD
jgi:hypothetical protein